MRALTMDEVGFVSGGNVHGPMFTPEGWQQLSAAEVEVIIVTAARKLLGGGGSGMAAENSTATSFEETSMGQMTKPYLRGMLEEYQKVWNSTPTEVQFIIYVGVAAGIGAVGGAKGGPAGIAVGAGLGAALGIYAWLQSPGD